MSEQDGHAQSVPVFFERPSATAYAEPIIAIQGAGATLGGAGRMSTPASAGVVPECHGELTVSMAAGHGSRGNPRIGEAARLFLLSQLQRLTDDRLRAILAAARVDLMTEDHAWRKARTGQYFSGIDAWVEVFRTSSARSPSAAARRDTRSVAASRPQAVGRIGILLLPQHIVS